MERIVNSLKLYIPVLLAGTIMIACSEDEDEQIVRSALVGLWTVTDSEINMSIGDQTLAEYLINENGLSEDNATLAAALFEAFYKAELNGQIEFFADNTYHSNFTNDQEEGTWELSADGKTLTLNKNTIDEFDLIVNTLTESALELSFLQNLEEDLDDDPDTPDAEIEVEANMVSTK